MMHLRPLWLIFCLLLLTGCEMMVPPWRWWHQREWAHQPVTCAGQEDCAAKWGRAVAWVKINARTAMVAETATVIKTEDSPYLSTMPSFTVTLSPGQGYNTIVLHANCSDAFGCIPPLLSLRADFAHYVMDSSAPLKKFQ